MRCRSVNRVNQSIKPIPERTAHASSTPNNNARTLAPKGRPRMSSWWKAPKRFMYFSPGVRYRGTKLSCRSTTMARSPAWNGRRRRRIAIIRPRALVLVPLRGLGERRREAEEVGGPTAAAPASVSSTSRAKSIVGIVLWFGGSGSGSCCSGCVVVVSLGRPAGAFLAGLALSFERVHGDPNGVRE